MPETVAVVIPALNAEATLAKVLAEIRGALGKPWIIVVDDGSSDGTSGVAKAAGAELIVSPRNRGVGAALKAGLARGLELGCDRFLTIGADDQRDARELVALLEALGAPCDMVIGSKFLGPAQPMPLARKWGNRFLTGVVNLLYGSRFSDVTSGFRALSRRVAQDVAGLSDDYGFDADLCIRVLAKGYRYREVPAKVFYRSDTSRMKSVAWVGLGILALIVTRKLSRGR